MKKSFKERVKNFFKINKGQETEVTEEKNENIVEETKTDKEELSNLQKWIKRLSAPYIETEEYKIFGEGKREHVGRARKPSVFWDTKIGYVVKYKNAPLTSTESEKSEQKNWDLTQEQRSKIQKEAISTGRKHSEKQLTSNTKRTQQERLAK